VSKIVDRSSVEYWERRLFRNTYTHRGARREVSGWCVKIQWDRERKTVRLAASERGVAAREAMALYEELARSGWEGVGRGRFGRPFLSSVPADRSPRLLQVGPRKYVSNLRSGRTREYFAEFAYAGRIERVALETEDENEAKVKAVDLRAELAAGGWERLQMTRSCEVTVAVFWHANPMTCTYATMLGIPATEAGGGPRSSGRASGWRVLVLEEDGAVRRALVHWLGEAPMVSRVEGAAALLAVSPQDSWDVVLVNRGFAPVPLQTRLESLGAAMSGARILSHCLFSDSDAIFASVSGVSRGYFLRRLPPSRLLEPLLWAFPEGPSRGTGEEDRQIRRYFQNAFEPEEMVADVHGPVFSGREIQVLDLLGRGLSDKEIASGLGISVWTVHSHLKRIFGKYGVRTRTEAVVKHLQK